MEYISVCEQLKKDSEIETAVKCVISVQNRLALLLIDPDLQLTFLAQLRKKVPSLFQGTYDELHLQEVTYNLFGSQIYSRSTRIFLYERTAYDKSRHRSKIYATYLEQRSTEVFSFIVQEIMHHFSYNFKLFQMHMVVLPNTLPLYLEQEFSSSKSFIGLRKIVCCLKYGKTGFT